MKIKIYQINSKRDINNMLFMPYDRLEKYQGSSDVDCKIYDLIYENNVECNGLEDVYKMFNINRPDDFKGHSLSVSDIVEVVDSDKIEKGFYFCDSVGFKKVAFSPELCQISERMNSNPNIVELSYKEMKALFRQAEKDGGHTKGYIVFTADSFDKPYTEESRTYGVSSNNKAFKEGMGGYSIYGSSLDGSDLCVRLEWYMAVEHGGKNGWKIERCYMDKADFDKLTKKTSAIDELRKRDTDADGRPDYIDSEYNKPNDVYVKLSAEEYRRVQNEKADLLRNTKQSNDDRYIVKCSSVEAKEIETIIRPVLKNTAIKK